MAIQFPCTQCGQPIEVDDEHAGKTAACPYCQAHVAVPLSSTYVPEQSVPARPSTPAPPRPVPASACPPLEPHPHIPTAHGRAAAGRALGNYALVCTVLALGLLIAVFVRTFAVLIQAGFNPTSAPSREALQQIQQRGDALATGLQLGWLFFAVVGLALGIASIVQHGNWRGIVGIVVCGLFMLCFCGSTLLAVLVTMGG